MTFVCCSQVKQRCVTPNIPSLKSHADLTFRVFKPKTSRHHHLLNVLFSVSLDIIMTLPFTVDCTESRLSRSSLLSWKTFTWFVWKMLWKENKDTEKTSPFDELVGCCVNMCLLTWLHVTGNEEISEERKHACIWAQTTNWSNSCSWIILSWRISGEGVLWRICRENVMMNILVLSRLHLNTKLYCCSREHRSRSKASSFPLEFASSLLHLRKEVQCLLKEVSWLRQPLAYPRRSAMTASHVRISCVLPLISLKDPLE